MSSTRRVAAKAPALASLIDTSENGPYGLSAISGTVWIHWYKHWTRDQREHYLAVIEREFPEFTAEIVEHLEWCAAKEGDVR